VALDLPPAVPAVLCDARDPKSARDVLVTLVESIATGDMPESE
jgi:hypothetical protein